VSDSKTRAQLEAEQAEGRRLQGVLRDWEEAPPEVVSLREAVAMLEAAVAVAEARQGELDARERNARRLYDELNDAASRARGRWWMSAFAIPAVIASVIIAVKLALYSLDYINWPLWAERISIPLLFVPAAVNGVRIAVARARRRK
jgi:hypothetical protein